MTDPELSILSDDLNPAIVEFHAERGRCTDSCGE